VKVQRVGTAFVAACVCALLLSSVSCGGNSPTQPSPGGGGSNQQPPPNNLPVIDSIAVQGTRSNEPTNFADVSETVNVTAKVHDDETPADQLQYEWSATVGSFTGTGSAVAWTAPADLPGSAPMDVTMTLKVIEKYGQPGGPQSFQHEVSGSTMLSLHNSKKEVGDMARQFLLDFSDSSIRDVSYIMRNFEPGCYGTGAETDQVAGNRKTFNIVRSNIGQPTVTVPFGNAFCPISPPRIQNGDACSATPSHWESTIIANGHLQIADGIDWVSAYYRPALKAWKLCDSQFTGTCTDVTTGHPCTDDQARGMVAGSWRRE
jgi:hypothetical protein